MKSTRFILIIICLTVACGGCGNMQFQSNEKPEDKVIVLETLKESPKSNFQDFKLGDDVAIIREDGVLDVSGRVEEIELPKGYKIRTGAGRLTEREWFPPSQIFHAPWTNATKLKVGDTVYKNHFGDFPSDKGVITELPVNENGTFSVRFDGMQKDEWVKREKLFSSIEPAAIETLTIGDIVYFNQFYWAIVVGKQDGKIIIRESGFPAKDKMVDVSKLQILK